MRIAVIGAGIAGLGCARALHGRHQVSLYESAPRLGGHTNTVDVTLDGVTAPVDTGFIVYNERTYPNLIGLFTELGVPTTKSEMSFAVSVARGSDRLEWAGESLATVFAQRRNLVSPAFWGMLSDLLRFNRAATAAATGTVDESVSLGDFLDAHGYGRAFRNWYLLPMAAAIWSCPMAIMLGYPFATFARFCHNHGLLQIEGRPAWFTVRGGARQYVRRIAAQLSDIRLNDTVLEVRREGNHVRVRSRAGSAVYDHVVLACHSDQSQRILVDADAGELGAVSAVPYQLNRALLHTDTGLLPRDRRLWSAWNYLSNGAADPAVSVSYLMNKLQPLPFARPLLVSLNPVEPPRDESVIAEFDYEHPIFDARAIRAQRELPTHQGRRRVWFAGAWTGYGFHEDGLKSGLAVAAALNSLAVAETADAA